MAVPQVCDGARWLRGRLPGINGRCVHLSTYTDRYLEYDFAIAARLLASVGDENAGSAPALLEPGERHDHQASACIKQTETLEERLTHEADRLREEAKKLRPGMKREHLLRQARQCETGMHISEWLRSPGSQPPKSG
ncbi:hypothetical protein [Bradyrhizobium liaoningense]|uniref:hypothetical protein n=1 Tax=Bradyrhizobium liaoningense TaxID=43992 RepID=UPI0020126045